MYYVKIVFAVDHVTSSCCVARNVIKHGLAEVVVLPESNSYDTALCCLAADIDFDGQSEVLIGTYGQVVCD